MKKKIICLIGPTAAGKTEVAIELAKRVNAEIISCDSMQIYKEIDIASCKPDKKKRRSIPHYLTDIISPSRDYNAARFRTCAEKIISDIHKRGKIPLIVGGTGLYLRALLDGLFSGPGRNSALRKRLAEQAKTHGKTYLYEKLKQADPHAARGIHPHDLRRVIRALEVYEETGMPISGLRKKTRGIRGKYKIYSFGLKRPRNELYARIEKRVDGMFRKGLVAEIRKLTQRRISLTAKSLLGYKEIEGFLKGKYSRDEARDLLKKNTRRYAKRQLGWFRKEKGVKWIEVGNKDSAQKIAARILKEL
jgi:tRNA dimethylallyltransferase